MKKMQTELQVKTLQKEACERVWYETMGSSWHRSPTTGFILEYDYINGNWESADGIRIKYKYYDGDSQSRIRVKTITQKELFDAWLILTVRGYTHCGVSIGDLESFDACAGAMILEQAILKEEK